MDAQGYCVVEDALPPAEVRRMLDVIERVRPRLEASHKRRKVFGLDVRPVVDEDPAFLELMEWPTTFPLAVRTLRHWNLQLQTSHLIMVPRNPDERNIGWHQDGGSPGARVGGVRALTSLKVGFFLTDLPERNMGSLMVVPGSHRLAGPPAWRDGARDPEGVVELTLRAGSAVIFQQGVWHAGAPNLSDSTRIVVYYGYGYRWTRPIDYESFPASFLAGLTPVQRQLLGARVSHLGYYNPTDADVPLKAWYRERWGEDWIA
jgi:ectoine hydroxylase